MAAGNGENFVTDNLDAIGGGDERGGGGGKAVASSILVACMMMVEGNAEEKLHVAANGREEIFATPEKKGDEEQIVKDKVAVMSTGQDSPTDATAPVWGIGQRVKVLEKCNGLVLFTGMDLRQD